MPQIGNPASYQPTHGERYICSHFQQSSFILHFVSLQKTFLPLQAHLSKRGWRRGTNRKGLQMTYTIWGNGGKYEWLIRDGETIVARSGSIFSNYASAKRAMVKALATLKVEA